MVRMPVVCAFFVIFTSAISNTGTYAIERYCRELRAGVSRCVSTPVNITDDYYEWCPYRTCGSSFGKAPKCGAPNVRATHVCQEESVLAFQYECLPYKKHRDVWYPPNCSGNECILLRTCLCENVLVERFKYTPREKINNTCTH